MSELDGKSFTYFSDIKLVLISEISVQIESACGFKGVQKKALETQSLFLYKNNILYLYGTELQNL